MKFGRFSYLYSLITVFTIPLIVEWFLLIDKIDKSNLIFFCVGISILGAFWDKWATRQGKRDPMWLWQFNRKQVLGLIIFGLPIEEYLFYVVTSLYIIFTWEALQLISETEDLTIYMVLPLLALWSFVFIAIPYFIRIKNK